MKIDKETFGKFFDGTPGKTWDDYAARLKNAGAGEVDDRGYSLADEYDGTAELRKAARNPRMARPCPLNQLSYAKRKQLNDDDLRSHTLSLRLRWS